MENVTQIEMMPTKNNSARTQLKNEQQDSNSISFFSLFVCVDVFYGGNTDGRNKGKKEGHSMFSIQNGIQ